MRAGTKVDDGRAFDAEPEAMNEIPNGEERRLVHRLIEHWRSAPKAPTLPTLDAVYGQGLGRCHRYLIVLDAGDDEPVFRFIGPVYVEQRAEQCIGRKISAAPQDTLLVRAVRHYRTVLHRRAPMIFSEEFTDRFGRRALYRSVLLPISNDGTRVTHLMGAATTFPWSPAETDRPPVVAPSAIQPVAAGV
jgi:hypothetical protein